MGEIQSTLIINPGGSWAFSHREQCLPKNSHGKQHNLCCFTCSNQLPFGHTEGHTSLHFAFVDKKEPCSKILVDLHVICESSALSHHLYPKFCQFGTQIFCPPSQTPSVCMTNPLFGMQRMCCIT